MNIPFRTEIKIKKSSIDINYSTPIMIIGSCFSDHIGSKLHKNKFNVQLNPFGVLYNPASISNALNTIVNNEKVDPNQLIQFNEIWHSLNFHGSFSSESKSTVLEKTTRAINQAHEFLKTTSALFITLGTSWVYNYINTQQIVANCHKIPSKEFTRKRLSVNDIISEWNLTIAALKKFNPNIKIVFTVSPVRHLKDGAHENQLSKSTLFLAIDEIIKEHDNTNYFPSYELIMDELRDYRFYADDMLHISDRAVEFIFEKFKDAYFTEETKACLNDILSIIQSANHRTLTNNKTEIGKFAFSMLKKIEVLEQKYPYVNFELEKTHFQNLI